MHFDPSNHLWTVTFTCSEVKYQLMGLHEITIEGHQCFLSDYANRTVIFKIFDAPDDARLSFSRATIGVCRDKCVGHINNGLCTARMRLQFEMPSVARIAGTYIRFWYPGQVKTCRRCGSTDHFAATCRSFRCFNCEKPGHRHEDCPEAKLCSVCKSPSHAFRHCPYVVHAVNFVAQPTRSLYADLASTAEVTLRILRIGVPSVCSMLIVFFRS